MKPYINANERVFLIKYIFSMGKQVICSQDNMAQTLKENRTNGGVEFIKEYNATKQKFERVSKKQLLLYFDWDTEAMEELKKDKVL